MIANVNEILNASTIESSRIEYKADWNPEKIMHTICAFANDIENIGGGYIIILRRTQSQHYIHDRLPAMKSSRGNWLGSLIPNTL